MDRSAVPSAPSQPPVILSRQPIGQGILVRVHFPQIHTRSRAGQFFQLRCSDGWSPYLRRTLFPAGIEEHVLAFWGEPGSDDGLRFLAQQPLGAALDLVGPLGRGFRITAQERRLLLVAQQPHVSALLCAIGPHLENQGSVGLFLQAASADSLLPPGALPPAVEYYTAIDDGPAGSPALQEALAPALEWADLVCAAGSWGFLRWLKRLVASARLDMGPLYHRGGFAQALAPVPLPCGAGACLACLVDSGRGWHRACVRGPVFDLVDFAL